MPWHICPQGTSVPRHKCPTLGTSVPHGGTLVPRIRCPGGHFAGGGGGGGGGEGGTTMQIMNAELKCPMHFVNCTE